MKNFIKFTLFTLLLMVSLVGCREDPDVISYEVPDVQRPPDLESQSKEIILAFEQSLENHPHRFEIDQTSLRMEDTFGEYQLTVAAKEYPLDTLARPELVLLSINLADYRIPDHPTIEIHTGFRLDTRCIGCILTRNTHLYEWRCVTDGRLCNDFVRKWDPGI